MDGALSAQTGNKKEKVKDIILKMHKGMSVAEAKERFEKEVGTITSPEIAEVEQALINEGMKPEEIKTFCNVHALVFQSALEKAAVPETFPGHPVYLFRMENCEVEKQVNAIKDVVARGKDMGLARAKEALKESLARLKDVEKHYERKEQLLFPFLEKHGFMGPSKVMWGKDNEIRDLMRRSLSELDIIHTEEEFETYAKKTLNPAMEEIAGMVFKENNILFPSAVQMLSPAEWVEILKESGDIGYVFIQQPHETEELVRQLKESFAEEPLIRDGSVELPTGKLDLKELLSLMNTLPIDITFVDKDDSVKYFSGGKDRIFSRTKAILGRKVQNCHPPESVDVVESILTSFKEGKRDSYEFWINIKGRFVNIRYFALRDKAGNYLGTMEITQDATHVRGLQGERRLLDAGTFHYP